MANLISLIFRTIARYFLVIIGVFAFIIAGIVGVLIFFELQLPDVKVLKDAHMQVPLRIYSKEGLLIAEYGPSRREPASIEQIPPLLIKAILATEDQRFYSHPGVDFIGLFRAFKVLIGTGQKSQGASTITMQVARNFFLTHKKTYVRKIREILLALKIERTFSKDKILELYLNKVYFGNHAYGVVAAANVYYGKSLDQLSLAEMAMIAGLPQAPSKNNPIVRPVAATERRNHVLLRMLGVGDISKAQYQQAVREMDHASYHGPLVAVNAPYIAEMVRQYMFQQYGEDAYDKGFSVYTTLSGEWQNAAVSALQRGLINFTERHGFYPSGKSLNQNESNWKELWQIQLAQMSVANNPLKPAAVLALSDDSIQALLASGENITISWKNLSWAVSKSAQEVAKVGDIIWIQHLPDGDWRLESLPKIQGALVSMDPQSGAILALLGGYDFSLSEFNRATQALRQPGSVFKPFIYAAALEKGLTLASTINDAPVVINDTGEDNVWRPRNDSRQFSGMTRLREGLVLSLNMVSIRLLQEIGIPYVVDYLQKFGFDQKQLPKSLSLALGTGLVSPVAVAKAYSVFANGGYSVTPYYIDHIVGEDDKVLVQANPLAAHAEGVTPVIDPQNAYLMTQVLKDVIVNGTGKAALVLNRSDIAGKTGTTNDKVDAWFAGFNSKIVTTIWVGYDDLTSTHEYGAQSALSIWIDYMRTALTMMPISTMPQPEGIVTARIDPQTGFLARADQKNAIYEIFRQGTEPHAQAVSPSTSTAGNASADIF